MDTIKDKLQGYHYQSKSNKALEDIYADPAFVRSLYNLGLTDALIEAYLPLVSSYQDDCAYCEKCPGLEQCAKEPNPLASMRLILRNGVVEREYSPCPLYMEKDRLLKGYLYRDFPEEWLASRANALGRSERVKNALGAMILASRDPVLFWAYFTGEMGSGRSYLLAAYTNKMVSDGKKVAFINANKRFDELKGLAISARPLFEKRMAELESCDLLVIDDFGSEYKSDYVRDQLVMPLLAERAKKGLPIFFASDFSLSEIQTLYTTDKTSGIYAKQMVNLIRSHLKDVTTITKGFETQLGKK